jgi:hypothetical protein
LSLISFLVFFQAAGAGRARQLHGLLGAIANDWTVTSLVTLESGVPIELRAEVFNLLNTPPLGAPAAVLGAANFGTITTAGDPRVVQLALKFIF